MLKNYYWLEVIIRPKILFYEDPTDWMDVDNENNRFYYRKEPIGPLLYVKKSVLEEQV
jgi:hypothetical protein